MSQKTDFILYQTPDGNVSVQAVLDKETIWLTQAQITILFGVDRSVVTKHIKNVFKTKELNKKATCAIFAQVQHEGERMVTRNIEFYNLDVILSVGYSVNSYHATQFRIWANQVLKNFLLKGYAVKDNIIKLLLSLINKNN